jgi:hypothetical protein
MQFKSPRASCAAAPSRPEATPYAALAAVCSDTSASASSCCACTMSRRFCSSTRSDACCSRSFWRSSTSFARRRRTSSLDGASPGCRKPTRPSVPPDRVDSHSPQEWTRAVTLSRVFSLNPPQKSERTAAASAWWGTAAVRPLLGRLGRGLRQQAVELSPTACLGAVGDIELAVDVRQMELHRLLGDPQQARKL